MAQSFSLATAGFEPMPTVEVNAREIVDSIPGLVCIMSKAGAVELINGQLLDYCGRTPEELNDWESSAVIHPDDLPGFREIFEHSLDTGQPHEGEHRVRRFDGVYRWFHCRGLPLKDSDGAIVRWHILLIDIEDRKQAEEKLRRSEAFLAQGQRVSSTGTFVWQLDTDRLTLSAELYRIFEFELDTLVTIDHVASRVHPEDLALLAEKMGQVRNGGGDLEYEIRLRMPDNRIKYAHTVSHVIRTPDGRLECVGAIQDETRRHLAEEALDNARSELTHVARVMSLGTMTASIAHEVNQPLSGIITNASTCLRMLKAEPPNVDGALEIARRMIRDCGRAADVIARLRTLFSKTEAATEAIDLNDATREVIALSLSEVQRRRVVVRQELAEDLPAVAGDRVQLQQVILNLLLNALEAMSTVEHRPRELLVRTEVDENGHVRVTVGDSGVGLGAHDVDKIFAAFYTTKSGGMGIGLSVSRSIIEHHRGRLWAVPNSGPGAIFAFSVPRGPELRDASS